MLARDVLKPGDVFTVRVSGGEDVIELGEALQGKPNIDDHVAGFIYWDGNIPWGLEGRPGGVGYVDMRKYIGHPMAYNNCGQPLRVDADRIHVTANAKGMIGTKYDWEAIGGDTLASLHVFLYKLTWHHGLVPGEVVCSSYWAYLYETVSWIHPSVGNERMCEPADWTDFILHNNYHITLEPVS